jgi:signal transduction histidine kinase
MRITACEISLLPIVKELVTELGSVEANLDIRFLIEAEESLPKIQGDAHLIGCALKAVMENAARANNGKGAVRVSIVRREGASPEEGWFQAVSIQDTGPGIDPAQIDYLWIPVAASYKPSTEGALAWSGCGLGLPTAFLAAEVHGGKIVVENSVHGEAGARVSMVFPESGPRHEANP